MSRFSNVRFLVSAAAPEQFPRDEGAEVAFAGRSNAGKSSAINAIAQRRTLARTSKLPGRTRLLNFFELVPRGRIVDLPGYGFASAPASERERWAPLMEALRARDSFRGLFLVVDARRGLAQADEEVIEWSDPRRHRVHVLLAKADKLTRSAAAQALRDALGKVGEGVSVQLFSAHAATGVAQAQQTLAAWLTEKKTPATSSRSPGQTNPEQVS
jgi:GTP-binding protein